MGQISKEEMQRRIEELYRKQWILPKWISRKRPRN
jgi:hypothetical protein